MNFWVRKGKSEEAIPLAEKSGAVLELDNARRAHQGETNGSPFGRLPRPGVTAGANTAQMNAGGSKLQLPSSGQLPKPLGAKLGAEQSETSSNGLRSSEKQVEVASPVAATRQQTVNTEVAGKTSAFQLNSPLGENQEAAEVIREMSGFPGILGIISGPAEQGALNVPVQLQDHLVAVKLTSGKIAIAYDPSSPLVKQPMRLMRAELSANYPFDKRLITATAEVLRSVRESRQKQAGASSTEIRSVSVERFKDWVREANELGATDLHLRLRGGAKADVQVRVDGELEHLKDSIAGLTDLEVLNVMKSAYEALADPGSNSDGNFSEMHTRSCIIDEALGIPNLRLRFASQRGYYGPKTTIRLLTTDISRMPMSFRDMGFEASQVALLHKAQRLESGIIFQCGVTGSGKTTVAKTFLETHPKNGVSALYQVADPVEYLLRNVHQINIQRNLLTLNEEGKKDPYSEVIESLMRMDPDGIDVGEVRDSISARAAANVAKTGHFALATLHCDGAMGAVNRLVDPSIGLTRGELTAGSVLGMICYQALVPKLCPECNVESSKAIAAAKLRGKERDAHYINHVTELLEKRFKVDTSVMRFKGFNPDCPHCRGRGTKGLTIVAEMISPDDEWLDLTGEGKDRLAWRRYREEYSDRDLTSSNMNGKSVLEHTLYKAINGLVDPTNLERFGDLEKYEALA